MRPAKAASRYGFAALLGASAFALTRGLEPAVRTAPFDLFQGAVVLTACFAGLGPALALALASIAVLDYFFIPPTHTFTVAAGDFLRLLVFGTVAFVTSSVSARLTKALAALREARDQLESRVRGRTADLSRTNALLEEEIRHRRDAEREILAVSGREQRRLGEDLHDGLCQTVAGLRLFCRELKDRAKESGAAFWPDLERVEAGLGEALAQADVLARGLYPVELEADGLMAALGELAEKTSAQHRIACRFRCASPVLVADSAAANHLYRVAQEAVANAVKHGRAGRISVRLTGRDGRAVLSVTDDGPGFKPGTARRGLGLRMMATRARVIDADFKVRSRARGVTRVLCAYGPESPGG